MVEGLTREQVHAKVDEVFDALEATARDRNNELALHRIMLAKNERDDSHIKGCVLVEQAKHMDGLPYITWGISPYDPGIHSGHYDLSGPTALLDWADRCQKGW